MSAAHAGPDPACEPAADEAAPVTVLVVDDEELTRAGLRALLSVQHGLEVVGEASDGAEVLPLVKRWRPRVVLMDVRMPRLDGITATKLLRSELTDPPKVVVITTFENDAYVWDALLAGAQGFIRKRAPIAQLAQAIRLVAQGDSLLFPDAVRRLAAQQPAPPPRAVGGTRAASLTVREEETLRLMARGLSNQQIAHRMAVRLETVKTHVGNVLGKLNADNRTHAVVVAYETGVLVPGGRASDDHQRF
ncbi:DNA-binding response regulator (plasmid) [Streptomyces nigrescens]|uniref:DNA-binding response regulator n=2 Tax=Streptomyces TaxID=1883 RepID=A0ABM8A781_STRNI|nr:response regulator transcription factor [Streptomyces nigrescens]MEE4420705.1 response regulator transcription factor [Streptomyces sp. DSM 41528]BDM74576.1 DNA-binding response regulator [Streptomyces nigrescens]